MVAAPVDVAAQRRARDTAPRGRRRRRREGSGRPRVERLADRGCMRRRVGPPALPLEGEGAIHDAPPPPARLGHDRRQGRGGPGRRADELLVAGLAVVHVAAR